MYNFIDDLNDYFCEEYANYDKLCVLPKYKMPVMQASKVREDGRTYAYTLPAKTMRLAAQEEKAELLAELKTRMTDTTFSFSFRTRNLFFRIKDKFDKRAFYKMLGMILKKYGLSEAEAGETLNVSPEIWKGICSGKFLPTKNLIMTLALTAHFSFDDTKTLLALCDYELDFKIVKDVVISYLLTAKVYNPLMVEAALKEYKVDNLFFRKNA